MVKALTDIKHDGAFFAAGDEVTGLPPEVLASLAETGALELDGTEGVEIPETDSDFTQEQAAATAEEEAAAQAEHDAAEQAAAQPTE